jgi:hypothetical protein
MDNNKKTRIYIALGSGIGLAIDTGIGITLEYGIKKK